MKILIDNGHGINTLGKQSPDGKLREWNEKMWKCHRQHSQPSVALRLEALACLHIRKSEDANQKIQLAKRRAIVFALISNFIDMAYLVSGKLKFDYPDWKDSNPNPQKRDVCQIKKAEFLFDSA